MYASLAKPAIYFNPAMAVFYVAMVTWEVY